MSPFILTLVEYIRQSRIYMDNFSIHSISVQTNKMKKKKGNTITKENEKVNETERKKKGKYIFCNETRLNKMFS